MINYGCPNCDSDMASPENMAGYEESCPECGTVVLVPEPLRRPRSNQGGVNSRTRQTGANNNQVVNNVNVGNNNSNGLGTAALVLGILALVGCAMPLINIFSLILL